MAYGGPPAYPDDSEEGVRERVIRWDQLRRAGQWWLEFPGAGASHFLREWLVERISEIESGDLEHALSKLRRDWGQIFDPGGVPVVIQLEVREAIDGAWSALRSGNADEAVGELVRASDLATGRRTPEFAVTEIAPAAP